MEAILTVVFTVLALGWLIMLGAGILGLALGFGSSLALGIILLGISLLLN